MTVRDLMAPKPLTVRPSATLDMALSVIVKARATELFVTDSRGKFLGILPDYELLKARLSAAGGDETVGDWMLSHMETLSPEDDLANAVRLFRDRGASRVAVLEKGKLVGTIHRTDILQLCVVMQAVGMADVAEPECELEVPDFTRTRAKRPKFLGRRKTAMNVN